MSDSHVLASRAFLVADQEAFAALSGDRNPMHMDPVAARRTQAGAPVVHGIHLLLWALESLASSLPNDSKISAIQAKFAKFVYVGERVAVVRSGSAEKIRLDLSVDGASRLALIVHLGVQADKPATLTTDGADAVPTDDAAVDLDLAGMEGLTGTFLPDPDLAAAAFPALCAKLGSPTVAAIAGTTRVVGMLVPGLHSIYAEASLTFVSEEDRPFAYQVSDVDPRFRMVRIVIEGSGVRGTLKTFARVPPVAQASTASLRELVGPDEFAESVALIVGGSRGLGEVTAKLIAAGGGHVILTYRSGKADAEAVAEDIFRSGGKATVLRYDAADDAETQLADLEAVPTHAYYFATPTIFKPQAEIFSSERLQTLTGMYVDGFWNMVRALRGRYPAVSIYYPSTAFVSDRPAGMTEYAMAKAAGEVLCEEINAHLAPTRVVATRLPRVLTDQTAAVTAVETASPVETMLPIVRSVQGKP